MAIIFGSVLFLDMNEAGRLLIRGRELRGERAANECERCHEEATRRTASGLWTPTPRDGVRLNQH